MGKGCTLQCWLCGGSSYTNGLAGFHIPWWNNPEGGSPACDSEVKKLEPCVQLSLSLRNLPYVHVPCRTGPCFCRCKITNSHSYSAVQTNLFANAGIRAPGLEKKSWLGRRFTCRVPLEVSVISWQSLFPHPPFSKNGKTADQSTNKSIAPYNLSRRRDDWVFCSNSAVQVWFGLRTCFGDSALQVPLPTQVSNRLGSMAGSGSFISIQHHSNCKRHYSASKASCFHFLELPGVAGAFWETWPRSAPKVVSLNPVSFLSSSCFSNNSTQKLYASLMFKVGLLPSP